MMNDTNTALGIDIGGTGIKLALVDTFGGKLFSKIKKVKTPKPSLPKTIIGLINETIKDFNWHGNIGCGFPGVVKRGLVGFVGNLDKKWIGINVETELRKFTIGRVRVINDADAAALAEMKFGAGKKFNDQNGGVVLIITLGTGIGSCIIFNGQILPNTEFGQIELDGIVAEKKAATIIKENKNLSWKKWSKNLNQYLKFMEKLISPDLIIIGGGISSSPEKFFPFLDLKTKIVTAKLGNNAGIIGAALAVNST